MRQLKITQSITNRESQSLDKYLHEIGKVDLITAEKALQWMGRQWSQDKILSKSDFEIVNDGKTNIDIQIKNILNII